MQLIPYRINKKVGYCLPDKTLIIAAQFDVAMPFLHDFAWVKVDNFWGVLKKDGSFHIKPKYEWATDYDFFHVWQYTHLAVQSNGRYGYMIDFQEIIPTIYDLEPYSIYTFVYDLPDVHIIYDLFRVKNEQGVGFVNDKHELVIPFEKPDEIGRTWYNIMNSSAWFYKENEVWNYKTNQRFLLPTGITSAWYFIEKTNLFCGTKVVDGTIFYGIFDTNGAEVLAPECTRLDTSTEYPHFFYFQKENGLTGLLSMDLKEIVPPVYTKLTHIKDGIFCAYRDNFIGLVNLENQEILIPKPSEKAQIIELNYFLRYAVFTDDSDYFITNLEGKVLIYFAKTDFIEAKYKETLFSSYEWAFEEYYRLITKNKTYIVNFNTCNVIEINLPIEWMYPYDAHFVAVRIEGSNECFLYNITTGKRNYPFFIFRKWSDRPHYLINKNIHQSSTRTKIGSMDSNEKIIVPIKHKGWQGIGCKNLEQFAILKNKDDYSDEAWDYYYWVDMLQNIVYAENLPKSK